MIAGDSLFRPPSDRAAIRKLDGPGPQGRRDCACAKDLVLDNLHLQA